MIPYLHAEVIRVRRTSVAYFPWLGVLLALMTVVLSAGVQSAGYISVPFSWQVMYFTGMAAPLMMLMAALSEQRERRARHGGLWWRGVDKRKDRAARLLILAGISALLQVLNFGIVILFGAPLDRGVVAALYCWIGSLGLIGLGALVARRFGMIAALAVGVVWQLIGVVFAESSWWLLCPPTWPIRILLVPVGVAVSGLPIPADNPALQDPPLVGAGLCALLGVVTCAAAVFMNETGEARPVRRRSAPQVSVPHSAPLSTPAFTTASASRQLLAFPILAVVSILRRSGVLTCVVLSALVVVALASWYPADTASGLFSYMIVPLGVGILPVLTWAAVGPNLAHTTTENPRFFPAYVATHIVILAVLAGVTSASLVAVGQPAGEVLRHLVLWLLVGSVFVLLALALVIRFGMGAALVAMIVWTIVTVLIGGDVLAESFLWVIAPLAWPETAIPAQRFLIAMPLAALGCVASWYAVRAAGRRHVENA